MRTITLSKSVPIDCPPTIRSELREILPEEWRITEENDSFVVRGPMLDGWLGEIWRVARFIASPTFVSLEAIDEGPTHTEHVLLSINERGAGYRIVFRLHPNEVT